MSVYHNQMAKEMGTRLHEFAKEAIELGIKQERSTKTLNMFINDAIGYNMSPEVLLFYSYNCFGTADAISFNNNVLRIHDLKTGVSPVSIKQLYIYAAIFCLEYNVNPNDIDIKLRIYQNDETLDDEPSKEDIIRIMDIIVQSDKIIEDAKQKGVV